LAQRPGTYLYRAVEVPFGAGGSSASEDSTAVLTVENNWETVSFVKEHMADIQANMTRVKQMKQARITNVDENAQLFERNLEPLFALISATAQDHVMDKLSGSLKKALLLMAMDRYSCDSESICRALGISKAKLEKELKRCGLLHQDQKAA